MRLHRAIHESTHSTDWSALARHGGYYGQAHLIGDFRARPLHADCVRLTARDVVRYKPW